MYEAILDFVRWIIVLVMTEKMKMCKIVLKSELATVSRKWKP